MLWSQTRSLGREYTHGLRTCLIVCPVFGSEVMIYLMQNDPNTKAEEGAICSDRSSKSEFLIKSSTSEAVKEQSTTIISCYPDQIRLFSMLESWPSIILIPSK